jgi:hypothetical protein
LETIWKEAVVNYERYYPDISLERLRETTKNISLDIGITGEIRTEEVLNRSLQRYRYANPLSGIVKRKVMALER